jgi:N-acetylmuramoyl-L-alanine amidase
MDDSIERPGDRARAVFAGLAPTPIEAPARAESRVARGVKHTVPIVLVGSLAATMLNVTGPLETAQAKRPLKPKPAAAQPGVTVKAAMAAAATTVAPAPAPAAVAAAPASYRVAAGDTVSDIAARFGLSTASVLALNGLSWSTLIFPGQELKLGDATAVAPAEPAPVTPSGRYTIVAGDTVSGIADRFGVSTFSVLAANGLGVSSIIYPGQTLTIPGVADPSAPAPQAQRELAGAPAPEVVVTAPEPVAPPVPVAEPVVAVEPAPEAAPPAGTYVVRSGDSPSSIAAAHGIGTQALLDANGLDRSSVIYPGGTLLIPAGGDAPVAAPAAPAPAAAPVGGSVTGLNDEMRGNAAVIVQVGRELGVSDYGIVIALATAMQESSLRNLTWGDRDSVGLFQQRPSTGWGSVEELTTPRHAATLFFHGRSGYTRGLLDIAGWEGMPLTVAAQRVQISGHPDAYAKWESSAWSWLAELG